VRSTGSPSASRNPKSVGTRSSPTVSKIDLAAISPPGRGSKLMRSATQGRYPIEVVPGVGGDVASWWLRNSSGSARSDDACSYP
jgi:hypothetical protein